MLPDKREENISRSSGSVVVDWSLVYLLILSQVSYHFFLYSCGIAVPFNAYYLYTHTCPQNRSHCLEVFGDRVCPSSRGWEHVLIRSMVPCMIDSSHYCTVWSLILHGGSSWCVSRVSVCALDLILRGHELLGSAKFTTNSASLRGTMFDGLIRAIYRKRWRTWLHMLAYLEDGQFSLGSLQSFC